jgi:hypothetical protein
LALGGSKHLSQLHFRSFTASNLFGTSVVGKSQHRGDLASFWLRDWGEFSARFGRRLFSLAGAL